MTFNTERKPGVANDSRGSSSSPDSSNERLPGGALPGSGGRSAGTRTCPKCGGNVSAHASVCPTCGEGLKEGRNRIRCRYCGERSPAELTICPYCGRELASAPSRILTWGVPALLVALFLVVVVRQIDQRNPLAWAQERLTIRSFSSGEDERGLKVVMTPVGDAGLVESPEADETSPVSSALAVDVDADQVTAAQAGIARVEAESAPAVESPVESDVENVADVATDGKSNSVATAITPDDSSSESAAMAAATVQQPTDVSETETSDAQSGISADSTSTVDAATAETAENTPASDETEDKEADLPSTPEPAEEEETAIKRPLLASVASVSLAPETAALPTATPTSTSSPTPLATPTDTPEPTATYVPMPSYEIRRGDTLIVIAQRHDVKVADLMRVNDISNAEAFGLQPGDELIIPVEGSLGAQEPTATPTATPVPTEVIPPTNTPLPTPTTPAYRVDAPILRSPEPGTPMSCSRSDSLNWLPVPFMKSDDLFVLHLGYVSDVHADGREMVVWVLEQPSPANITSWDMDTSLCALAPQEFGRRWKWYVEVAENNGGTLRPVSPPSEIWGFDWN